MHGVSGGLVPAKHPSPLSSPATRRIPFQLFINTDFPQPLWGRRGAGADGGLCFGNVGAECWILDAGPMVALGFHLGGLVSVVAPFVRCNTSPIQRWQRL